MFGSIDPQLLRPSPVPAFVLSHLQPLTSLASELSASSLQHLTSVFSEVSALFSLYLCPGSPANLLESIDSTHFPLTWGVGGSEDDSSRLPASHLYSPSRFSLHRCLFTSLLPFAAKSDELRHIESHSCIKNPGGRGPATGKRSRRTARVLRRCEPTDRRQRRTTRR
jgi:hypothetical protein